MKRYFIFLLCLPLLTKAELFLPSIYSDHMVLQQKTLITIWGWADPGEQVSMTTSWTADTIQVKTNAMAKWEIQLKAPPAGGPYDIVVFSKNNSKTIKDVLIGEVWLCSGQSNMEWGAHNGHQEIIDEMASSYNSNIRLFNVPKIASHYPQEDIKSEWLESSSESLKRFSSIGYFIAKRLEKELNVPIGIINTSWGGTSAEMWLPDYTVKNDSLLTQYARNIPVNEYRPHDLGSCWNSMINPLTKFKIAGVFWYQGESNVWTWHSYDKLFKTLIQTWRESWEYDFPFYFVQIAPFEYKTGEFNMAAHLRNQQTKALSLSGVGMVVTTDLVDDITNIHPERKIEVANRLADMALAEVYEYKMVDYKSPVLDYCQLDDEKVIVHFNYLSNGLKVKGNKVNEIFISGKDTIYYPAKVKIRQNTLEVSSEKVRHPYSVKFGFSETAMPNLFNTNDLPVAPFKVERIKYNEIL